MNFIKLNNRYTMKSYGFECALEWTNSTKLQYNSKGYNEFYKIHKIANQIFGCQWSRYVNTNGVWYPKREDTRTYARIYFRNEKHITLVQLAM